MENYLSLTNYWLEKIIIGLDLCPFARIPFSRGLIHVCISVGDSEESHYQSFIEECERLLVLGPERISTTLIAFPNGSLDFMAFNDFVGELEESLCENQLDDMFQVVAFHPKFISLGLEFDDLANFVNRSPYPTVHIIRVSEMEKAVREQKGGEQISFFNEKKLKALSPAELSELYYYLA